MDVTTPLINTAIFVEAMLRETMCQAAELPWFKKKNPSFCKPLIYAAYE
jgi:hypothetical protein